MLSRRRSPSSQPAHPIIKAGGESAGASGTAPSWPAMLHSRGVRPPRRIGNVDHSGGRAPLDGGAIVGAWRAERQQGLVEGGAPLRFRAIESAPGRRQGAAALNRERPSRCPGEHPHREPDHARPTAKPRRRAVQARRARHSRMRTSQAPQGDTSFARSNRDPVAREAPPGCAEAQPEHEDRVGMSRAGHPIRLWCGARANGGDKVKNHVSSTEAEMAARRAGA
jgi:hypothetical protein